MALSDAPTKTGEVNYERKRAASPPKIGIASKSVCQVAARILL
jgi:hypothetical protein